MTEKIYITFLGTGSATPTVKRNHPGIFLTWGSENILFECGEGIQRQFKIAKINPCKLTKIFISHWHGDHTLGLPGLLETLAMNEYTKTLDIYGPKGTKSKIELFEKIYGRFKINFEIHEITSKKVLDKKSFFIDSAKMIHKDSTYAYSFNVKEKRRLYKSKIQKLKLPNSPILGDLQNGKDITYNGKKIKSKDVTYIEPSKKITMIMDTLFNKESISLAKNSDILICEASFSNEEKEKAKEYNHMTSEQAAKIAKKSKSKALYLIHLSQRHENNPKNILDQAKKIFPDTSIPKDFDSIVL